ncbi:folate family ECF transporter S component [Intestinibacillus massiliensis]|uniref:folate family ECF transporter S component n=1 Tax=Intestinibacillus massiliensis TaxID=1871029 RepID=UPI000B357974|nr:folate family ECF transporter S component [Intestinibacillus massiliensis]
MQKNRNPFVASLHELKSVRCIALTALLIALNVAMDLLNIRIWLSPDLRVGIGFLLNASIAMLFGPTVGMMAGFCTDVLGYLVNPVGGAYFPGYTITAIMGGLIYGLWFYGRRPNRLRAFGAKACINLVCNVGLNTLWLSMTGGKAMALLLPARLAKNVLLLPFEAILLYLATNLIADLYERMRASTPPVPVVNPVKPKV